MIGGAAENTATGAGSTVMFLDCVMVLLQTSVNVQVSVTLSPHAPGSGLNVDVTVPLIRHDPLPPFV